MQFFVFDTSTLEQLTSSDIPGSDISNVFRSKALKVFENADIGYCLEAYHGICDDHDVSLVEFTEHPIAANLTDQTSGDTVWHVFTRSEAQALLKALSRMSISKEDAENYLGDEKVAEDFKNLQLAQQSLQTQLALVREGQLGVWRVDH